MIKSFYVNNLDDCRIDLYRFIHNNYVLYDINMYEHGVDFGICGEISLSNNEWLIEICGEAGKELIALSDSAYKVIFKGKEIEQLKLGE